MRRIGIGAVGSTSIPTTASQLLSEFVARGESWMPEHFGFYEPVKNVFCGASELEEAWTAARHPTSYVLRKRRIRYSCTFAPARSPRLGSVAFKFSEKDVVQEEMMSLLKRTCEVLQPELVYLQWGSDIELRRERGGNTLRSNMAPLGIFTEDVTLGPKKLYWSKYFGPRIVERFGRELLLSLPTEKTEELLGGVLIQLSPSLKYDDAEYETLQSRRLECIRRLGRDFFREREFVKQAFATAEAPWIPPKLSR